MTIEPSAKFGRGPVIERLLVIVDQLLPAQQQEVEDFAQFLANKYRRQKTLHLKQEWAGALKELRDEYTSVELQHKSLEWWTAEASALMNVADSEQKS
ncbi:MAG: DUF2281 domain-containing protein [Caldilineaceae bacterium]|nr:DUF2281 domain-containing protein [Caldilineaceae bacterium]MBP8109024.1 DUF2281 domain-containing protein [Caldilineaceae bacterium]MBP8124625.1 DUF2281 domain-containing protein [Caldilineaceae bacterium]MBP9074002.1 DUF2281 domain-containing protein [Caldilineaceae bacterium]